MIDFIYQMITLYIVVLVTIVMIRQNQLGKQIRWLVDEVYKMRVDKEGKKDEHNTNV